MEREPRSRVPNTNRKAYRPVEPRRGTGLCAACVEPLEPSLGVVEAAEGIPWRGMLVHPECSIEQNANEGRR